MSTEIYTQESVATQQNFISRVYGWMSLALAMTGVVSWMTITTPALMNVILKNQFVFFGLIIAELLLVVAISGAINVLSSQTATVLFFLYSALNGITLSVIFLVYTAQSIASTFFITAGTFAVMAVYGYTTKKDLTTVGNLAMMALIGIIIASIVNIFLKSDLLYWGITYIGILVFIGLIAYDTQKIKQIGMGLADDEHIAHKSSIIGALRLYLDFINLFIMLLRVFGRRR